MMELPVEDSYSGHKRPRSFANEKYYSGIAFTPSTRDIKQSQVSATASKVIDFSDPYATQNLVHSLESGEYGSVTNDIKALLEQRRVMLHPHFKAYPALISQFLDVSKTKEKSGNQQLTNVSCNGVINLDDDDDDGDGYTDKKPKTSLAIITIDSDEEEDQGGDGPSYSFQSVFSSQIVATNLEVVTYKGTDMGEVVTYKGTDVGKKKDLSIETKIVVAQTESDGGVYEGESEESENSNICDEYEDIWNEMSMGLELSKDMDATSVPSQDEEEEDPEKICDHSFVLRDDTGYVCRVCGVIGKKIDKIFEFQYLKVKRSTRTYLPDSRNNKDTESVKIGGFDLSDDDDTGAKVYAHPRHTNRMKAHQVQGFQFLVDNLVGEKPGGCILAHAPGSGKTFMIISFMQSFFAKYPNARPLVVLPKGILSTWKKEFQIWQIEDIPLLDFYSVKADNRTQQLEVLKKWVKTKSVLFLGYKQFSVIVCDQQSDEVSNSCKEILLKAPSILILDEGHTPRNDETDVFGALAKVQTPRKVVLSGTLYQNHVKEVFTILNLVRPKFLRMENTRPIVKRIMSKVDISGVRIKTSGDAAFYDLVEATLQKDKDFRRKVSVIHDLREMTGKVLHYYKGDFLDELPGLIDLTVVLNLSPKQKREVGKINSLTRKFKASSVGSAVYLHPKLDVFSDSSATDEKMDQLLEDINIEDGVKAKFFLNMLRLCESKKEKLLVFSQYLTPLKFLERLAAKEKGWRVGMEMFVITGDSSSEQREFSMEQLNNSPAARVLFGSIKACGEGISLVGASRIIILDIHLNPSVTRQAIGRAFRPGQKNKVFSYRLVAGDSLEEEDHKTCLKKELISRMWFEWNEYCGNRDFEVLTVNIKECEDEFLMNCSKLTEDITTLYKR